MTTYTLVFCNDLLIACLPDGSDIDKAVREESESACASLEATWVETGVILTDSPRDDDDIVYRGDQMGCLRDDAGKTFDYAVVRAGREDAGLDDPHKIVADHDGTPEWLEHLRDAVYEGLPASERAWWHVALAEAIPTGTDLDPHYHAIMACIVRMALRESYKWADAYRQQVIDAITGVAALHDACAAEDDPRWSAMANAARAAWATSATWAADAAGGSANAAWAADAARAARVSAHAANAASAARVSARVSANATSATNAASTARAARAAAADAKDAAYLEIAHFTLAILTGGDSDAHD